jgi:CDP-glucose 4,6-dehydratase
MEDMVKPSRAFWSEQRVLLTGHTGFKGAWLALWLEHLGATVTGLSLAPDTEPSLFKLLRPYARQTSLTGDIRDRATMQNAVSAANPTIAFHLAAQALVRRSYREPVETVATNVTGAAMVLDTLRAAKELKSVVVITTDKVYRNNNDGRPFRESDTLGGHDPYSASKAAAELVVASMADSFLPSIGVATVRAGNVIGGGDWSDDRIVPDLWRAARTGTPVELRNPDATRPWQHVLDPLCGYLIYAERLARSPAELPRSLNFGPADDEELKVADVAEAVLRGLGASSSWRRASGTHPPEMKLLALDASLARATLGWGPRLAALQALAWTAEWYVGFDKGANARKLSLDQIARYTDVRPT